MRDGYYERDSGIGDFEGQDSGNNHLNEPRAGKSVDANSEKSRSLASHAVVSGDRVSLLATQRESETQSPKNDYVGG